MLDGFSLNNNIYHRYHVLKCTLNRLPRPEINFPLKFYNHLMSEIMPPNYIPGTYSYLMTNIVNYYILKLREADGRSNFYDCCKTGFHDDSFFC